MLDNSMCLLWGSMMMPKTKLVVGNGIRVLRNILSNILENVGSKLIGR